MSACNDAERPEKIKIKIIETSDVHGAVFPYDFVENKKSNHSLAQVYAYVKQEKAKNGQLVILVDNGDILQGDPTVYYYNFIDTKQKHFLSQVMNFMEYDAATVGNHDIEPGHTVYDKIKDEFNFPWLAANAIKVKTGKPYFKPYCIIEKQGVKIAVLGLITPAIPQWLPESIYRGIEFEDMIESAKYWVDEIRRNDQPDLLIGLFHAGNDYTYNNQNTDTPKNENASKLVAEQVPGFDIVFVGHDHHGWNQTITNWAGNEVTILGPSSKARDVAVATAQLTLHKPTNHYKKNITGEIVNMDTVTADAQFMQIFKPQYQQIEAYVAQPLGYLTQTISTQDAFFGDAAFTDLIHRVQIDLTGSDISFTAPLSFNKEIIKGKLYVRDLFKIYRYENLLYTMKLGGQEIKDYLEYSYSLWFDEMKSGNDHLINFKRDSSGVLQLTNGRARLKNAYYNFDNAEGIDYTVDLSRPFGNRVKITAFSNGNPFDYNKTYSVAINSYRGNGGGGHLTTGAKIRPELLADRIIANTDKDFRYYLMEWIKTKDSIKPNTSNNWQLKPDEWITKARQRDFNLLFGTPDK